MSERGPRLRRQLGLLDTTAVALGAMIGAGIFVALGEAAGVAGGALPSAIVLAALVAICNGLSAVELGVDNPRAGGAYEFGYQLLSPAIGFGAGWLFLLAGLAAGTTYTIAFASYLQPLMPGLPLRATAVVLALLAVAVNAVGVQFSRRLNNLLVAFKVAALVAFVVIGLAAWDVRVPMLGPARWGGLLQAGALFFFAFAGYARPVTIVEELRDPARDLPRAVILALAGSTVLYFAVALVALTLVGPEELAASPAPLRDALAPTGVAWAQGLISWAALIAAASVLLTEIWGLSRLAFAMARRNDLPAALGRLTPAGVPRAAVLVLGALVVLFTATVDLGPALAASSLSLLLYYAVMNWAALRLEPGQRLYPRLVSYAGLLSCVALAFSLPVQSLLIVGAALAAGFALRLLMHW